MEGYWQGSLRQPRLGQNKPEINNSGSNRASHHEKPANNCHFSVVTYC
jgi:hypothetical protein